MPTLAGKRAETSFQPAMKNLQCTMFILSSRSDTSNLILFVSQKNHNTYPFHNQFNYISTKQYSCLAELHTKLLNLRSKHLTEFDSIS